jgi:hypothetical protein
MWAGTLTLSFSVEAAARVTANKGAMPAGMVFVVTLAFIGVTGGKQKQNNR